MLHKQANNMHQPEHARVRPALTARPRALVLALLLGALGLLPALARAVDGEWKVVSAEQGKKVEFDPARIDRSEPGKVTAWGRIVLDRELNDPRSAGAYQIIEAQSRYDCAARNYATLKRVYRKSDGSVLREEDVAPQDRPVRSGTLDDKLLREVCRPERTQLASAKTGAKAEVKPEAKPETKATAKAEHKPVAEAKKASPPERPATAIVEKAQSAAADLKKANEAQVRRDVHRAAIQTPAESHPAPAAPAAAAPAHAPAPATHAAPAPVRHASNTAGKKKVAKKPASHAHWGYEGEGAPEHWGELKPEYATCATGQRQSPIDIRSGVAVDQPPIEFSYQPGAGSVLDNGHTLQYSSSGSAITVQGKRYELLQFHFHLPAEERVDGQPFDMVAHLVHKAADGQLAVVAILIEKRRDGDADNPFIQALWNNMPLEKNQQQSPAGFSIDPNHLIPPHRGYYSYMGSLTTPPCTEGVLWLVMKQPMPVSSGQIRTFARLYPHNARPIQPTSDRLIKVSR